MLADYDEDALIELVGRLAALLMAREWVHGRHADDGAQYVECAECDVRHYVVSEAKHDGTCQLAAALRDAVAAEGTK